MSTFDTANSRRQSLSRCGESWMPQCTTSPGQSTQTNLIEQPSMTPITSPKSERNIKSAGRPGESGRGPLLMPTRPRKTRMLLWPLVAVFAAGAIGFVWLLTLPAPLEIWLQKRVLQALREHFHGDVQLQNLRVTLVPSFRATAENLVLSNRSGSDLPPLITVQHVTAEVGLFQLLRTPVHINRVKLDGLEIQVTPKRDRRPSVPDKPQHHMHLANFVIDTVEADGTKLYVLRKDPAKDPMEWDIRKLSLQSAGIGQPMKFQAELTNPTPPGVIETTGHFGPWDFDEPSTTAVSGHYNFQHADLSVFNGISGALSSTGDFSGTLHNIVVDGAAEVPDFQLDRGGQAVQLNTKFHAIVNGTNGTNGNTTLQPVTAQFLKSSVSILKAEVASKAGQSGKTIEMEIDMHDARVQDVLALASKSQPSILTGRLNLHAELVLPPGHRSVLQKMLLNGNFKLSDARFSDEAVKKVVTELSRRGQGRPNDSNIQDVLAEFIGDFRLQNANLSISSLQFAVPGVKANMKGSYGLSSEQLSLVGDVRLSVRVSQTMAGTKRVVLVPFDPLFMKHGAATYLPITIAGTRSRPQIKMNWKELF